MRVTLTKKILLLREEEKENTRVIVRLTKERQ